MLKKQDTFDSFSVAAQRATKKQFPDLGILMLILGAKCMAKGCAGGRRGIIHWEANLNVMVFKHMGRNDLFPRQKQLLIVAHSLAHTECDWLTESGSTSLL